MKSLTDTFMLEGGVPIPCVGFGTWQTPKGDICEKSVEKALETGYRHIDTAYVYGNEEDVGKGIAHSGISRGDIFVTSKLWNKHRGYENALKYFERSLQKLGLEYLDLYLIHWPANEMQFGKEANKINADTWRAFEKLKEEGRIRAIGVSNFTRPYLERLALTANIKPAICQIEYHPGYTQPETVQYCAQNGILPEAWSPLGSGRLLGNETVVAVAEKYGVSPARLMIRWCLQNGVLPLPKSVTPSRIEENADVFGFEIASEDMTALSSLPQTGWSGLDPDKADF